MKTSNISIKRFLRSKFFMVGTITALLIVFSCVFADKIVKFDPTLPDFNARLLAPEWFSKGLNGHVLGTDALGRDILARLLYGGRFSLLVSFIAVSVAALIGCVLGTISGFYSNWIDMLIMRFGDIQLSIPPLMLAIAIVAVMGPNLVNLVIVLIIWGWPGFARLIRGNTLSIRNNEFVSASRVLGASNISIMFTQVFPNVLTPTIVYGSQALGGRILTEAALSYLGLGVQPPTPSWGVMIANGRDYLTAAPWVVLAPGLMLMFTVLAFNLLGDGIRDVLDPKMK